MTAARCRSNASGKGVTLQHRQRKRLQVRRHAPEQPDPGTVPLRRQGEGQQVVAARLRRLECGLAPLPGGVRRLEQPGTDRPRQRGQQLPEKHRRHGQHELPHRPRLRHRRKDPGAVSPHRRPLGQHLGVDRRRQLQQPGRLHLHQSGQLCRRHHQQLHRRRRHPLLLWLDQRPGPQQHLPLGFPPGCQWRQRDYLYRRLRVLVLRVAGAHGRG